MATVTKPIALNESFNTTEVTPRNIADVLAQALQMLNTTISGLNFINCVVVPSLPTTGISTTTIYLVPKSPTQQDNIYDEYINLDGTVNGWEKIGDTEIDLSNYYTKTQTDTLLNGKVDTVAGMGLSHNDFTDTEKTKLSGIESGAEVNVQSDWSQADSSADDYIKNKPSNLVSDASYVHTDNNFTNAEKTKLGGIESGAEVNVQSDWNEADNTKDDYIKNKPSSEVKSATDTFTTVNGGLLEECNIDLEPIQDLHGYDNPWVGGAGKNKFDGVYPDIVGTIIKYKAISVGNGTFTISTDCPLNSSNGANIFFLAGNVQSGAGTNENGVWSRQTRTVTTTDGYVTIAYRNTAGVDPTDYHTQIESGSTATAYEPYSNICPISGHTEVDLYNVGKNLLNPNKFLQGKPSDPSDTTRVSTRGDKTIVANVGDTFTASCSDNNYMFAIFVQNESNVTVYDSGWQTGTFTKTIESGQDGYLRISFRNTADTNITVSEIQSLQTQIEKGSSPTAYEPYLGHLYQVQIGSTVYGGYVDLVSGVMVATHAKITLDGTENIAGALGNSGSYQRYYISGIPNIKNERLAVISSHLKPNGDWATNGGNIDSYGACVCVFSSNIRMSVPFADRTTLVAWITSQYSGGTPVEMCYELATPFTIQLTPQQIEALVGQNNLSTPLDGQSIDSVEYREVFAFDDVEKVVSLRVPISMLGTDESGRTTASQAYASGDYFYKDGYMCKALTSISAGATLTLNTNYSQGTLADILKAIENA